MRCCKGLEARVTRLEQVMSRRGEATESWVKRALEKELAGPVPSFDREEAAEETSGFNRAEWHEASSDYWQARGAEAESELDELKLESSERHSEDRRNIERLERRAEHMEGVIRRKDDHSAERTKDLKEQVRDTEVRLGDARRVAARFERELVAQTSAVRRLVEVVRGSEVWTDGRRQALREALAPFTGDER